VSLDFVALDWETANGARGSPCSVGLVEVRAGTVTDRWHSLIRPPARFAAFDPANTAVHGLTARDVAEAPTFADVWPTIEARLSDHVVIAHNAQFDLDVIRDATWAVDTPCPSLRYGCTLLLARRHYHLPSYTLDAVARAADVDLDHHHDALADALAAASILLRIAQDAAARSVTEVFEQHGIALGVSAGPFRAPCRVVGRSGWRRIDPDERHATPTLW
jgi:DNA polymerase-3 subunit epsilon